MKKYQISDLERKFDLEEVFDDHGIDFKDTDSHYIICECPDCGGKDKLFVDKKTKMWVCFKCAETDQFNENKEGRGNLRSFLTRKVGMEPTTVKKIFEEEKIFTFTGEMSFKMIGIEEYQEETSLSSIEIPDRFKKLYCNEFCVQQNKEAYDYLISRNVTTFEQIRKFNIMYDRRDKRIVFPAIDRTKKMVGYQMRDITERWKYEHPKCENPNCKFRHTWYFFDQSAVGRSCPGCELPLRNNFYPKSKNSKNFPKTEIFFNEQNINPNLPITIVEGPFDCINVPNSVAFLGKVLSETQFSILREWSPSEVILYMDQDKHGIRSIISVYNQISPFFNNVSCVLAPKGTDPGSFTLNQNISIISGRLPFDLWYKEMISISPEAL